MFTHLPSFVSTQSKLYISHIIQNLSYYKSIWRDILLLIIQNYYNLIILFHSNWMYLFFNCFTFLYFLVVNIIIHSIIVVLIWISIYAVSYIVGCGNGGPSRSLSRDDTINERINLCATMLYV